MAFLTFAEAKVVGPSSVNSFLGWQILKQVLNIDMLKIQIQKRIQEKMK